MSPSPILSLIAMSCAIITSAEDDQRMAELCLDGTCSGDTATTDDDTASTDDTAVTDDTSDTDDTAVPIDGDGDGYTADQDCDDSNDAVHPGATEIWYDGVDQDCDGHSDFDADGDGDDSDAYSGGDCDDADAAISSLATEQCCDGIDNDCDEDIDEECTTTMKVDDADATVLGTHGTWSISRLGQGLAAGDLDGDGQSDDIAAGSDRTTIDTGAGAVFAFHNLESGSHTVDDAFATIVGSGGRNGYSIAIFDADLDGYDDILSGDFEQNCLTTEEACGGAWLTLGPLEDGQLVMDSTDAAARWRGTSERGYAGFHVSGAGPWSGAAYLAIGAPADSLWEQQGSIRDGCAYLVASTTDGAESLDNADMMVCSDERGDHFGASLAAQNSISGDSDPDIIVGAPSFEESAPLPGSIYAFTDPWSGTRSLTEADYQWDGIVDGDGAGVTVLTTGDFNGDGHSDLATAAARAGTGGEIYILNGGLGLQSGSLADADATLTETHNSAMAGSALAAGDIDQDGFDDIIVGSPYANLVDSDDHTGVVYVMYGPLTGSTALGCQGLTLTGAASHDYAGTTLTTADINDDTYDDVVIGSPNTKDTSTKGYFHILYGGPRTR